MNLIFTLSIALLGVLIAQRLKLPSAVLLGAMLGVGCFNIITGSAQIPSDIKICTQGIAGAFIGMQFQRQDFARLKKLAAPLLLLVLLYTLEPLAMGLILHRIFHLDLSTALFSCVPGGVSDVSIIAMEMNAETSTVALLQTSRQLFVLLLFPLWIIAFNQNESKTALETAKNPQEKVPKVYMPLRQTLLFLAVIFLLSLIGKKSGISAGSLIFSMVFTLLVNCFIKPIRLHPNIKKGGQFFSGALIGTSMSQATLTALPSLIGPILLLLTGYWLLNLIYGLICSHFKLLDRFSAMFSACPAGAGEMSLIAADHPVDLSAISLLQILRRITAVTLLPQLIRLMLE